MPIRTFQFRLNPTRSQYTKLNHTLGACRWTYNNMVSKIHKEGFQSACDLGYFLTELKEQNHWLYEHYSKMLQMISIQVAGAQKALVALNKKGYKTGKLRFALYNKYNTFVYNQSGFKIENNFLHLSKIGKIPLIQHREIPDCSKIKQVTVSRQAGKWFACVTFDVNILERLRSNYSMMPPTTLRPVGIDVGIKNFAYDSDGHVTPNPLNLSKMLKPLQRIQRKISRRQKGSNNRKKAIRWYQRIHQRIANQRKDFCHKLSTTYAKNYGITYLEDLKILNMVQNHHLARNIIDSGWGTFKKFLQYKTCLVLVPPHNTSVDCSRCGIKVPKTLVVRIHMCNVCGLVLDRDHNAAINILKRGLELQTNQITVPQELRESTPVEMAKPSLKQEEAIGLVR